MTSAMNWKKGGHEVFIILFYHVHTEIVLFGTSSGFWCVLSCTSCIPERGSQQGERSSNWYAWFAWEGLLETLPSLLLEVQQQAGNFLYCGKE